MHVQLIPLLIAETIYDGSFISSALTALHQQYDRHGRTYLAINLFANQTRLQQDVSQTQGDGGQGIFIKITFHIIQ